MAKQKHAKKNTKLIIYENFDMPKGIQVGYIPDDMLSTLAKNKKLQEYKASIKNHQIIEIKQEPDKKNIDLYSWENAIFLIETTLKLFFLFGILYRLFFVSYKKQLYTSGIKNTLFGLLIFILACSLGINAFYFIHLSLVTSLFLMIVMVELYGLLRILLSKNHKTDKAQLEEKDNQLKKKTKQLEILTSCVSAVVAWGGAAFAIFYMGLPWIPILAMAFLLHSTLTYSLDVLLKRHQEKIISLQKAKLNIIHLSLMIYLSAIIIAPTIFFIINPGILTAYLSAGTLFLSISALTYGIILACIAFLVLVVVPYTLLVKFFNWFHLQVIDPQQITDLEYPIQAKLAAFKEDPNLENYAEFFDETNIKCAIQALFEQAKSASATEKSAIYELIYALLEPESPLPHIIQIDTNTYYLTKKSIRLKAVEEWDKKLPNIQELEQKYAKASKDFEFFKLCLLKAKSVLKFTKEQQDFYRLINFLDQSIENNFSYIINLNTYLKNFSKLLENMDPTDPKSVNTFIKKSKRNFIKQIVTKINKKINLYILTPNANKVIEIFKVRIISNINNLKIKTILDDYDRIVDSCIHGLPNIYDNPKIDFKKYTISNISNDIISHVKINEKELNNLSISKAKNLVAAKEIIIPDDKLNNKLNELNQQLNKLTDSSKNSHLSRQEGELIDLLYNESYILISEKNIILTEKLISIISYIVNNKLLEKDFSHLYWKIFNYINNNATLYYEDSKIKIAYIITYFDENIFKKSTVKNEQQRGIPIISNKFQFFPATTIQKKKENYYANKFKASRNIG